MAQGATPSGITGLTPPSSIRRPQPTSPTSPLSRASSSRVTPSPSGQNDVLRPGPSTALPKARPSIGLPRPGLSARKSITNLRGVSAATPSRSQTPDSLASSSSARSAARPSSSALAGGPATPAAPRRSLAGTPATASRFNTPTRSIRAGTTPRADADTPPVPALDARYAQRKPSKDDLNIDDLGAEVEVQQGDEKGYRGILRYLGEIQGKGQVVFAGIELLDEWHSLGKNDGTVAGVQYFATNPQCGMFLAPWRLRKLSNEAPIEAVARPQSAMSGRQSRASEHESGDRPPSTTPARRRTSMAPTSVARPGSSMASQRSTSRASTRPDSALSTSRPASRTAFTPRKSVVEEAREDSLAQRRAKTSAEHIAAAQGRINPGSRAAQLMNMKASDWAARKQQPASDPHSTPARPRQSLSSRTSNSSPLKDALTNKGEGRLPPRSFATPGTTAKPRKSIADLKALAGNTPFRPSRGGASSPTSSSADMPPPVSASRHQRSSSTIVSSDAATTPRNAAHSRSASVASHRSGAGQEEDEEDDDGENDLPMSLRSQKARSLALLEAMDLDATPKKASVDLRAQSPASARSSSRAPSRAASMSGEAVAEGVVPLSIYEEVYNELAEKNAQLAALSESRDSDLERERKRLRDDQEAFKRMIEEERATEREDEKRRRGGIEARETEARGELDRARAEVEETKRDLRKARDEASKTEADKTKLEGDVREQVALVEELKKLLAVRDEEQANDARGAEYEGQLRAKDAELEQLKKRVERLQTQWETERAELTQEIDELKDAGQETITLYELRLEEAAAEAQAAADEAEDRIRQLTAREANGNGTASGGAASIDREALEEQLSHAQSKVAGLEDQLSEALTAVETEREAAGKRKERASEAEAKWKGEVKKLKAELDLHALELREARDKVEELHEALEERGRALESERAELETLRAEAHEGDVARGDAATISKLKAEVEQLTALLEGARSGKREASRKVEELERKLADATMPPPSPGLASPDHTEAKRFSSTSSSSRRSGSLRDSLDPSVAQSRELAGLKSIVNAMSEENADLRAQLKGQGGGGGGSSSSSEGEVSALREEVKSLRAKLDAGAGPSLAKRNEELTREVSDLEALVEAGMWAKEELEAKLEDCERKLKRAKEKAAAATGVEKDEGHRKEGSNGRGHVAAERVDEEEVACDDCGSKEHRLEDCPLLDQIF